MGWRRRLGVLGRVAAGRGVVASWRGGGVAPVCRASGDTAWPGLVPTGVTVGSWRGYPPRDRRTIHDIDEIGALKAWMAAVRRPSRWAGVEGRRLGWLVSGGEGAGHGGQGQVRSFGSDDGQADGGAVHGRAGEIDLGVAGEAAKAGQGGNALAREGQV